MVGGCIIAARPSGSLGSRQCYAPGMHKIALALTAALLASPAWSDTLL